MKIRVLIVDDSAFMRKVITQMLQSDEEIEVIGAARNGLEAVEKVRTMKPDIVTLDVEMPVMNGIEALKIIMKETPLPVLMVSSLTEEGAQVTLDALDIGAVDYLPKNLSNISLNISKIKEDLLAKIKAIGSQKIKFDKKKKREFNSISGLNMEAGKELKKFKSLSGKVAVVAIGVSTGGPKALQEILPIFPKDFSAGILVVQHMPKAFTGVFAERLNQMSKIEIKEAENGDKIRSGLALIAPGNMHMTVERKSPLETAIKLSNEPADTLYKPSVDVMMKTVAQTYAGRCVGVILTGMGHDGRDGIKAIKETEGKTLAQDEESCVVFGMPKSAIDIGVIDKVVPLSQMAFEIMNMV